MADRALRPCSKPGCSRLSRAAYCDAHAAEREEQRQARLKQADNRPSAAKRGYNRNWSAARRSFLAVNPWCAECERKGTMTAAAEVDHIKPHRGDMELFWNLDNMQPLCKSCHSRKTATEDGGFGYTPGKTKF